MSRRRRVERLGASVLGIALVLAVIGGTWSVLSSANDKSPSRDLYADASTTRDYVDAETRVDELGAGEGDLEARERNLEEARKQSAQQIAALRTAVGSEMSDDDLYALSREVNLLCSGSEVGAAEASEHLQQNQGLSAEAAAAVIQLIGEC